MYQLHTKKQLNYFDEVIRLHYEEGYGEDRISRLLPVSHSTVSRWITIFAKEKKKIPVMKVKRSYQSTKSVQEQGIDVQSLQKRVKELEAQLSRAEMKAKFYDKMIDIAEAKFKISIRKKSGAKQ
jgi:transposase